MRIPAFFISAALMLAAASPAAAQPACTPISNATELQAIANDPAGTYCLTQDIDLGSIDTFTPIPTFSGKLIGGGHVIRNLTMSCEVEDYVRAGLFALIDGGSVEDLGLKDIKIDLRVSAPPWNEGCYKSNAGALAGTITGTPEQPATISKVYSTGNLRGYCPSTIGGLVGEISANAALTESWSSVRVVGCADDNVHGFAGGLVGRFGSGATITRSFATGRVEGDARTRTGGLVGFAGSGTISQSFAAGAVRRGSYSGGLIGLSNSTSVSQSFALGPVNGLAGLIGFSSSIQVTQAYAVGRVSGGEHAKGLIGHRTGTVTASFWDTDTTDQTKGGGGVGLLTAEFQRRLPPGFAHDVWDMTGKRSYPFISGMAFIGPLSTVVHDSNAFVFLPLDQHDVSEYRTAPNYSDEASKAAAFTMIARAIGATKDVTRLENAKIDGPFWDDAAREANFEGPLAEHATLGQLTTVPAARPLGDNVVSLMNVNNLVLLRGKYRKQDNSFGTHWLLGTLYRRNPDRSLASVAALDPWTGRQVMIDPISKGVVSPAGFPLRNFRVDAYQPVVLK